MLFCLSIFIILSSCKDISKPASLITESFIWVEKDPSRALQLLGSISNPQKLSMDDYMHYIVAYTYAEIQAGKDVKNDTLIYLAKSYFDKKNSTYVTMFADFSAGRVLSENDIQTRAISSFFESVDEAITYKNDSLLARTYNNIGHIYYRQNVLDSAVIYLEKSKDICTSIGNADLKQNNLLALGCAYKKQKQLDLANIAFVEGLALAEKKNNKHYIKGFKKKLSS